MLLLERPTFRTRVRKRFDRRLVLSALSTPSPSPSRVRALHFSCSSRPLLFPAPPLSRSARAPPPLPPSVTSMPRQRRLPVSRPSLPSSVPLSLPPSLRDLHATGEEGGSGGFRRTAPPYLPTSLPRSATSMQPERRVTTATSGEVGGSFSRSELSSSLSLSPPPHLDLSSPPSSPPPPPPTPPLDLDLRDAAVVRVLASSVVVALFCCCNKQYFFCCISD